MNKAICAFIAVFIFSIALTKAEDFKQKYLLGADVHINQTIGDLSDYFPTHYSLGPKLNVLINEHFGVEIELNYGSFIEDDIPPAYDTWTVDYLYYAGSACYYINRADENSFFFGGTLGRVMLYQDISSSSYNESSIITYFTVGGRIGYSLWLDKSMVLLPQLLYQFNLEMGNLDNNYQSYDDQYQSLGLNISLLISL